MGDKVFMVERPADQYGNVGWFRGYGNDYFDGKIYPVVEGKKSVQSGLAFLLVSAPKDMLSMWDRINYNSLVEVEGPARWITEDELRTLWVEKGLWIK